MNAPWGSSTQNPLTAMKIKLDFDGLSAVSSAVRMMSKLANIPFKYHSYHHYYHHHKDSYTITKTPTATAAAAAAAAAAVAVAAQSLYTLNPSRPPSDRGELPSPAPQFRFLPLMWEFPTIGTHRTTYPKYCS